MTKRSKYFNKSDGALSLQTMLGYPNIETLVSFHVDMVLRKERSLEDAFNVIRSVDDGGNKTHVQIGKVSILECFGLYKRLGLQTDNIGGDCECVHLRMQVVTEDGVEIFGKHYGQGDHGWLVIFCNWYGGEVAPYALYKEVEPVYSGPFEWSTVRKMLGDYILSEGIYDDLVVGVIPRPDKSKPSDWDERPIAFSVLDIKLAVVGASAALNHDTFKEVTEDLGQVSNGLAKFIQETIHTKNFYVESFWLDRGLVVLSHLPNSKNTPVFR